MERGRLQQKKKFLRHHTAGLGDGNFRDTGERKKQDLALPQPILGPQGNNRYVRTREGRRQVSPYDPPDVLDRAANDVAVVPFAPGVQRQDRVGGQYGEYTFEATATADEGPWQLSVLALLGIIAVLVVLFLHLISDPQAQKASGGSARPHYGHHHTRRTRRRDTRSASFQTNKKKFDEWSEDEVVSDENKSYQADSEAHNAGGSSSTSYVAPVPLYYPHDYTPQQQHRQRKQVNMAAVSGGGAASMAVPGAGSKLTQSPNPALTVIDSRPFYHHHRNSKGGAGGTRLYATGSQEFSPGGTAPGVRQSQAATVAVARYDATKEEGLGTGLEGFNPVEKGTGEGAVAGNMTTPRRQRGQEDGKNRATASQTSALAPEIAASEAGNVMLQRMSTPSPFQSFDSLPLDVPQEPSPLHDVPTQSVTASDGDSGVDGKGALQQHPAFELDYSPPGLRNRRGGEEMRPSVAVQSGSCDHDFTPRVHNVKRRVAFPKLSRETHESDVESASGDLLPPPPFYSSAEEEEDTATDFSAHECEDHKRGGQTHFSTSNSSNVDSPVVFQEAQIPFLPELGRSTPEPHKKGSCGVNISTPTTPTPLPFEDLSCPPRSVTVEELHLIKMESGDMDGNGAQWMAVSGSGSTPSLDEDDVRGKITNPELLRPHQVSVFRDREEKGGSGQDKIPLKMQSSLACERKHDDGTAKGPVQHVAGGNESQIQLMKEIAAQKTVSGADVGDVGEPATPIQHKRPDVTKWSDASASLTLPIDFSELKLKSVIGGGGFGQVWKATWRGTPVAVKILSSSAQTDSVPKSVLEEFASEINMVSGMRHPNICLYMGACLVPPNRAIVTEFAAHGSLWDALRSPLDLPYTAADGITRKAWPLSLYRSPAPGPMAGNQHGWYEDSSKLKPPLPPAGAWPWALIKHVSTGAVRGMTYLHGGKPPVLHRDLKSANLLLDDSYTTKVADFGLSRIKAQERSMTGNCGTVQWMAPEILANQSYAEPADVYSFGIILWEMLSQECPFEGMSPIQCALAVLNNDTRPKIPEWCPSAFSALIERCVERNPSARPTFPQILAALDAMP